MTTATAKVAIVGAGNVGSTFAFSLMHSGVAREIVLIDKDIERAESECMDLSHGASFVHPVRITAADYSGCREAAVIVLACGAKQKPGETRLDLAQTNAEIFKDIVPRILSFAGKSVLLVVTNPVDILTYVTLRISGLPQEKVMGCGTVLDSSRFRFLISEQCRVDPRNVHAYIIGEHGDSELPVWSHANIGGMSLAQYCPLCGQQCDYKDKLGTIFEEVKNAAYKIIAAKGATYYAVALALSRIVEAVIRDENSVLPISTLINDYYGINDVCLSIPAVVNRNGVERFLRLELCAEEQRQLQASAEKLRGAIERITLSSVAVICQHKNEKNFSAR